MDAIIGILNNPLVLALVGYAVSFAPGVRAVIPQRIIPFLNTALAWCSAAIAPQAAQAAGGPFALEPVQLAGFGLGWMGSFGTGLAGAVWQAAQAFLIHRMFGRGLLPEPPSDSKR